MHYVISDIHGCYAQFTELLDLIDFKDTDTLYVLGDIVDRGPHPIKVLSALMELPNAVCIVGNHELMALDGLRFLYTQITNETIESMDKETLGNLFNWIRNGGQTTIDEFQSLSPDKRQKVIDFIMDFSVYEELAVNGQKYLLVHAGLGDYDPEKNIEDYSLKNLVWDRNDYNTRYFEDVTVITGHTPTQLIKGNRKPGSVYRHQNNIAIDCGCYIPGGRLAAICLETGEEFYSSVNGGTLE